MSEHTTWQGEPCNLPDLNEALDPWCLDASIEIAWDQWARVRIFCMHGTAEGVSGGLCLNEAFNAALKSWRAMEHEARVCYADTPAPQSYLDSDYEFWSTHPADCELYAGHEGDHFCFEDDDEADLYTYRYERLKYFKNGHDRTGTPVFGSTVIPHPYREYAKKDANG